MKISSVFVSSCGYFPPEIQEIHVLESFYSSGSKMLEIEPIHPHSEEPVTNQSSCNRKTGFKTSTSDPEDPDAANRN